MKKSIGINAVLNVIRQCCNILFPLIIYPYVSRVLGAENLGKYSFSESVLQYTILFSGLGISTYAVREGSRLRDDKQKIQVFSNEVFSINLLSTLITYVVYFLLIAYVPKLRENRVLLLIMGIDVITTTLARDWINTIYEDFAYTTVRFIVFQTLSLICTLIFVKKPEDYVIYTVIVVSAVSSGYLLSLIHTSRHVKVGVTPHLNLETHLRPVMILFANALAQWIYVSADIIMLGLLRTDAEVGIYTLSTKVYSMVKGLLIAIVMVTIPRISHYIAHNDKENKMTLLNNLRDSLITFVLPCVTGLTLLSGEVVTLIGGADYGPGGPALSILCFALAFAVFGTYYAQAYLITHRMEKQLLLSTVISALSNVLFNLFFIPVLGINGAAYTTLISEAINCFICGCYAKEAAHFDARCIYPVVAGCGCIVACCFMVKRCIESGIFRILVAVPLSVIVYFLVQITLKNRIVRLYTAKLLERIKR